MENLTKLLSELALSLGTTSEFLWSILIKQAFISGVIDIVQYVLIIMGCWGWWLVTKRVSAKIEDSWEEENYIWVAIVWVFLLALVLSIFFNIQNTVASFINPGYWALDHIMSNITSN